MNYKKERRGSSRIQPSRQAELKFQTEVYENCLIQNLSQTGMFVHGDFHQNVGERCVVNFTQGGTSGSLSLEACAQIERKDDDGVAISFTSMSLESLMLLQMILHCDDGEESYGREIKSFDSLPFKVHDDLLM